jgi:hypothetical protein
MKQAFKDTLSDYHEFARRQAGLPERTLKNRDHNPQTQTLEGLEHWATKKFGTDNETQARIFAIQKDKAAIVSELKRKLAALDGLAPEPAYSMSERPAHWQGGSLNTLNLETKEEEECTVAELLTDLEWGIGYNLDSSTPRNIRKQYYLEQARSAISDLRDQQIIINEAGSAYNDSFKKDAYRKIRAPEHQKAGHIAEKMVRNFLRKIAIDLGNDSRLAEFEVIKADAYQDVDKKIDFIIKRKAKLRGVKVEAADSKLGIQFTTDQRPETIEHKGRQISNAKQHLKPEDMVDDIILVSLSLANIMDRYDSWKLDKKAGGPDKLWGADEKKSIFENLMRGILTPDEIGSYLAKLGSI